MTQDFYDSRDILEKGKTTNLSLAEVLGDLGIADAYSVIVFTSVDGEEHVFTKNAGEINKVNWEEEKVQILETSAIESVRFKSDNCPCECCCRRHIRCKTYNVCCAC